MAIAFLISGNKNLEKEIIKKDGGYNFLYPIFEYRIILLIIDHNMLSVGNYQHELRNKILRIIFIIFLLTSRI